MLNIITCQPKTPFKTKDKPIKPSFTLMTSKSIRRAQKAYKANLTKANLDVILRSQERLATQHKIDQHLQKGLLKTLKTEKKRRQHRKKLNLVGEKDSSAQLFGSSEVCVILAYKAEKEALVTVKKAGKAAKKAQAAKNKQRKKAKAQEKAL